MIFRLPRRSRAAGVASILAILILSARTDAAEGDKPLTINGTIARLDAAHQSLVVKVGDDEIPVVWTAETRINGVLSPGARVTVRYTAKSDGQKVAHQISVGK